MIATDLSGKTLRPASLRVAPRRAVPSMGYTTFLLDLDHTLFDSDASESAAFEHTLRAAGIRHPGEHFPRYQEINLALWAAVERGEVAPQAVKQQRFVSLANDAGFQADPARMATDYVAGLAACGELYDGVLHVLDVLRTRVKLGLITNGLSEVQRARLERVGIADHFDAVVISAEIGAAKPRREIFEHAFRLLNRPNRDAVVMVGDNLNSDIRGGADYGIATCWYNPARRERPATSATPTHEIRDLAELLDLAH